MAPKGELKRRVNLNNQRGLTRENIIPHTTNRGTYIYMIYMEGNFHNDDLVTGVVLDQEQKLRLLDNSETIERTGQNINTGYRIILETEEIGTQVLQDLYSQRETIQKSRQRVKDVNEELSKSSRTLSRMLMSSVKNRLILFLISLVFIIVIVSFLIYSFNKYFN